MKIWTMGEILVEIMRVEEDMPLDEVNLFRGPYPSGAPAIFIDTVARLGHKAGIIGGVGEDAFGRCNLQRLEQDGVDTRLVQCVSGSATAVAFVAYETSGERTFIYHIGGTPATIAKCPEEIEVSDPVPAYFHIMGCSLMADETFCEEIIKTAALFHRLGAKISFDPNIRTELLRGREFSDFVAPIMQFCSVLLPGLEELRTLTGQTDIKSAIQLLFLNPVLEVVAVKMGKEGCRVFTRDSDFTLGVCNVDSVDPTGAGDSFDAAFLCGLLDGLSPLDAARQASAAAALNTSAFGPMEGDISQSNVKRMLEANKLKEEYL